MGVMMNSWSLLPFPTQAGQVGGHEGVGKIVKMGPGTDSAAVKVGDRVGIKWMAGICESCEACRAGMDACCSSGVSSWRPFPLQPPQDGSGEGEGEGEGECKCMY
jgi:propanol-preferring alcohol dehydrogenase